MSDPHSFFVVITFYFIVSCAPPRISKQASMEGGCDYDLSRSQSVFSVH